MHDNSRIPTMSSNPFAGLLRTMIIDHVNLRDFGPDFGKHGQNGVFHSITRDYHGNHAASISNIITIKSSFPLYGSLRAAWKSRRAKQSHFRKAERGSGSQTAESITDTAAEVNR